MPRKTVNKGEGEGEGAWLPVTAAQVRVDALPFGSSELTMCIAASKRTTVAICLKTHRKVFFVDKKQLSVSLFLQKQLFVQQKILS